jgi:hypothetical protein
LKAKLSFESSGRTFKNAQEDLGKPLGAFQSRKHEKEERA